MVKRTRRPVSRGGGSRGVALDLLCSVEERGAFANLALGPVLDRAGLARPERAFVTELVYGVVRRRLTLDWVLGQLLTRPADRLAPWVRNLLRLSLYQLMYLSRVPPEAACDEAVELAKGRGHQGIANLVNAVLRNYLRKQDQIVWPDPVAEPVRYLSTRESHPEWLVRRWVERLGFAEAEALLRADNVAPPVVLRANRLRTSRGGLLLRLAERGLEGAASRLTPEGVILRSRSGSVEELREVAEGYAQVQDEASMLIAHLVAPEPGERVLDAASAPGGKTTHLAELMGDRGEVRAFDLHPGKLGLVEANARRLGLTIVRAEPRDARSIGEVGELRGAFDRALLDAPCTGLGVLRRRPDARWRKGAEDIATLAAQQRVLIRSVAACVRRGGRLVYSTCSTEPEEGEQVVEDFLSDSGGEFVVADARAVLAERGIDAAADESAFAGPYLRLWPQRHGTDGFFGACLIRRG